ncbi:MAG TPA: SCO family protein [Candidatus Deferrimicrobium sp.]
MTGRKWPRFPFAIAIAGLIAFGGDAVAGSPGYKVSIERYDIPDVVLMNQEGAKIRLKSLIESDKPVVLDFIYATCTTICPVLSAGFMSIQAKLGADTRKMQLISISIDPEHDTPKIMKEYMKPFRAKPGWDFLTGTREDIDRVMRAFDSYIPDKMNHKQETFIRERSTGRWVRIKGLIGTTDLMSEIGKANQK